jgi:hypothetical protein
MRRLFSFTAAEKAITKVYFYGWRCEAKTQKWVQYLKKYKNDRTLLQT